MNYLAREGYCSNMELQRSSRLTRQHGFLASHNLPSTGLVVDINVNHAVLPREVVPTLFAAGAPRASDDRRGAIDAHRDVADHKGVVLDSGGLDARDHCVLIEDFAGGIRAVVIIAIHPLKEAGIVEELGVAH